MQRRSAAAGPARAGRRALHVTAVDGTALAPALKLSTRSGSLAGKVALVTGETRPGASLPSRRCCNEREDMLTACSGDSRTGCDRGIGRVLAEALVQAGASLQVKTLDACTGISAWPESSCHD